MKKLVSIMLVAVMLLLCLTVPASTLSKDDVADIGIVNSDKTQTHREHQFEEKFQQQYKDNMYLNYSYDEVYYYYNGDKIEWALVEAHLIPPPPHNYYAVFGDKFSLCGREHPFSIGYGVYDCKQEKFFDIAKLDDFSVYETLDERINGIEFLYKFGDADINGKIDITDATCIQKALAGLITFPKDELQGYDSIRGEMKYTSDIDRDMLRTVMDATMVQKTLAKIDDSITEPITPTLPPSEEDVEQLPTAEPTESGTLPENPYHIEGPKPLLYLEWVRGDCPVSILGKEKKVYCCFYDKNGNIVGDSNLFSKQHLAVVIAGKNTGIRYFDYYPEMRGLELEVGHYMYDFYNEDGRMVFRSFVTIK